MYASTTNATTATSSFRNRFCAGSSDSSSPLLLSVAAAAVVQPLICIFSFPPLFSTLYSFSPASLASCCSCCTSVLVHCIYSSDTLSLCSSLSLSLQLFSRAAEFILFWGLPLGRRVQWQRQKQQNWQQQFSH